ncbi:winged helix-turn-helix domain-containing protein [Teredinibacter haidensis]|uniref:winged helix-turn-helix domain-containing protein n=1 Tax=Teredinibacter haidensis TaxID=2731755 RepID=UPI000A5982A5|nr:LysR family transcriptional regulator [Teredinibacter haidensis]
MEQDNLENSVEILQPSGDFKLGRQGRGFVSERRINLLEAIEATGSISLAAKQTGLSYKGARDSLEQMNNLEEYPLMARQAGGRYGDGTMLTPYAN